MDKHDFHDWKHHMVTKALMAFIASELDAATKEELTGTPDEIVKRSHRRNKAIEVYKSIQNWKPEEGK